MVIIALAFAAVCGFIGATLLRSGIFHLTATRFEIEQRAAGIE